MPTISIACGLPSLPPSYVLHHLARHWESQGLTVASGPDYIDSADSCALHVDKTRLSGQDVPAPPPGRRVINGVVLDISKSLHSALRVKENDGWDGQVIVKTDLNHYGLPERLGKAHPDPTVAQQRAELALRDWQKARQLPDRHYPVVNNARDVPDWVWNDPAYIVERFIPEREGDLYCIRGWMFLGSFSYGWRLLGQDHMVKATRLVRHEFIDDVPEELLEVKKRTGFDFGKFDYVMHEGKAVVLDLNKTPSYAGDPESPRLAHLARGIEEFLP